MDRLKMRFLRRLLVISVAAGLSASAFAASEVHLEPAGNDVDNIQSLQRGARNFVNYCSGCHSAKYVRYNTIGKGLGLTEDQIAKNLMFNAQKTFETMQSSMPEEDAARWFGQVPPDMSLIARSKSTDYVYNFLKGFYLEEGSPTGVNNRVLPGTSMPNVLWELQGHQRAVFVDQEIAGMDGMTRAVFESFEPVSEGTMSAEEFDDFVRDTANFLEYISEPERSTRRTVGTWVIAFLLFFLIVANMLKNQIWKDVK